MNEDPNENEELSASPETGADLVSMIQRMQQQLNMVEKKIDALIEQSEFFGNREKRFSKPFRAPFGGRAPHGKGHFHRAPRKEGFSHERSREGGFSHGRPGFERERPFDRKTGHRGFSHGDKPFFRHRKEHRS